MKKFLYNVLDWSYRRLVTLFTLFCWIIVLILAGISFVISGVLIPIVINVLIPVIIFFWATSIAMAFFTKKKTENTVKWSLRNIHQQYKDWKAGRKLRKEVMMKKEYGI